MELKQYAAEHIIENGKHYPEKWVNRYFIEVADAQRALDAEREKVKAEQEQWEIQAREGGRLKDQLTQLQAQLADRDAMILQMGEQAAVLARENMAVKAQLRQVGESKDAQWKKTNAEYERVSKAHSRLSETTDYLIRALEMAQPVVCSMLCPSVKKTGEEWLHVQKCDSISLTLRTAKSMYAGYRATLAAQDAGKHHEVD